MKGKLIVFEGGEGCGKTTQLRQTHQWLQESGWLACLQAKGAVSQLVLTREPGGTELGQRLRQILLDHTGEPIQPQAELLLYAADRAQHVAGLLQPLLAQGGLILCDRYTDSTLAYQGYGRGLDRELIDQLNQVATGGLTSDLTLWLDVPVEVGLARTRQRGLADRMEQADLAFHQRVYQGFTDLAAAHPQRIIQVDATPAVAEVTEQIQTILHQALSGWYGVTP